MSLLITQAEIEALPEDSRQRFARVEQICRERYKNLTEGDCEWSYVKDCRLRYLSSVLGAAKYLRIEPLCDIDLPRKSNFSDDDYDDFVLQIEFYTMQLMLEGADRNSRVSVVIEGNARDRVITLISHLKDQIDKLDISASRRDALLHRIKELEKELERSRISFVTIAAMVLFVAGATADLGGATDVVRKLVGEIEATIGLAKEEQDKIEVNKLPSQIPTKKLLPPRQTKSRTQQKPNYDLDDDIPF